MRRLFKPVSLGVAVLGTGITGVALMVMGVASLFQAHPRLSAGTGAVLLVYGALVLAGAWLGARRSVLAQGLIVAPALLHVATAVSLLGGRDPLQLAVGGTLLGISAVTLVAALWPSTTRTLRPAAR